MTSRGRIVLVVGPPLAGVGGVVAALRPHLPGVVVVEAGELPAQRAPDVVLGVVSAVAPLTRSDWMPIASAASRTDLVIGVVSKVDAHRGWRDVMAADRTQVAAWSVRRESMTWLGVAAAPSLGRACIGELVDLLRARLADPELDQRNRVHGRHVRRHRSQAPPAAGGVELRYALQRARMRLLGLIREGCSELRAELRDAAAVVGVGGSADFESVVEAAAERFHASLVEEITQTVAAVVENGGGRFAARRRQDLPYLGTPPSSSRRLETRLMAVLAIGFGLGLALASSRVVAGLAPGLGMVGLAAGAAVGVAVVWWVVRARGLLHDRALLDRWVTDVCATLRWHGEAMVADRLLEAESAWVAARPGTPPQRLEGRAPKAALDDPARTRIRVTDQYEWC